MFRLCVNFIKDKKTGVTKGFITFANQEPLASVMKQPHKIKGNTVSLLCMC